MNPLTRIATAFRLKCPRCHEGRLFIGLLRMHESCPKCGLTLEPEPGFYLGSIYANYAVTVLTTTAAFLLLTFGLGYSKDIVIWGCLAFTFLFPLWFFRYARSIWLSLIYQVNSSDFVTHDASDRAVAISGHSERIRNSSNPNSADLPSNSPAASAAKV